jgi:SPP1 family predicted phage head-tail adaptor
MNNLASRMTKQINLQSVATTANTAGGFTSAWTTFATVWAEVAPVRGSEIFDSDQVEDVEYITFTIRYMDGVTPAMRIEFCGNYYNIRSIINPSLKNEMLEILGERTNI